MAAGGKCDIAERCFVSFVCQRCCQPLKLDSSFNALDEQVLSEFSSTPLLSRSDNGSAIQFIANDKESENDEVDYTRKVILPLKLTDSGNGFMLVSEMPNSNSGRESLSHHLAVTARLFDILSDQSDIDHPLCEECSDTLLDQMDHQLRIAEDECKDYREFLEQLQNDDLDVDSQNLEQELERLKEEERKLQEELKKIEQEQNKLEEEKKLGKNNLDQLEREEERYWLEYSDLKSKMLTFEDDQRSVDNQLRYANIQLEKLKKTNVFNATFHIWHSGHFGTINNFRLGRLPAVPVDWAEINAAWGQTVLLLHSLAKKVNLTFQRYRLVPYGNHSFLESLEDKSKELPLHGSGGFKFFWDTKFDQAMVAFLDCLQQFKEEVEKGDKSFLLPYKMEKGRVEDPTNGNTYSIKIQFNSEEQWTKALKFMLTNLKWGLAWVSSQFTNK